MARVCCLVLSKIDLIFASRCSCGKLESFLTASIWPLFP